MKKNEPHRRPVVLAVDDQRANLIALEALLGDTYEILLAGSGDEALLLVRNRWDIDLILMDVQMPFMDGFEAARAIKKLEAGQSIPIIFVTAIYNEDPYIKRGFEVGGIDYFSKPFDPDILKMKVAVYAAFRTREKVLLARERHIRESEELLRVGRKLSLVLESLRVGVLIADAEGRICQSTNEVQRIFKSLEPLENDSYGEILGWWDLSGRLIKNQGSPLAKTLREGQSSHSEPVQIKCLDGSSATILFSASPLYGIDKRLVGAVVLIQDITEQKKIEEALEERVSRLIGAGLELEEMAVQPA
jgi:response regulator RpfG family c-di-GMP phosphodiesterase